MTTPGKNYPSSPAYFPTPDSLPETSACRTFRVPANDEWLGVLMACVMVLANEWNWYQWGTLTPDEASQAWQDIILRAYADSFTDTCLIGGVPTPYWDTDNDVDDNPVPEEQPWYGYVTNPELPADELTFIEQSAIWAFTGFLAVATIEVGAYPAVLFNTIAPRFVLATRRGDVGEIIRILVDGDEAARVDTSGYSAGDVIRTAIIANPELETHDIMIIQVS